MNVNEENFQRTIEDGRERDNNTPDARAYRQVFRALSREPEYPLSGDFVGRVAALAEHRRRRREARDYWWFAAGVLVLAIASMATIRYTGFRFEFGFLKAMSDYKGLAVFAFFFVLFLHWLDKRFVHDRQHQH